MRPDGLACSKERDGCWGLWCMAGEGKIDRNVRERETERRPGPHCKDGGIVFLLLKVEGLPCGGKISHELDLTIK